MHEGIHQQALRIDEDVPLLALDLLAAIKARRIDPASPFSALLTLWLVDDGRGRAGLPVRLLTADYVEGMVQPVERAVVLPAAEVVVHRAARRQVFGDRTPLTTGAQLSVPPAFSPNWAFEISPLCRPALG